MPRPRRCAHKTATRRQASDASIRPLSARRPVRISCRVRAFWSLVSRSERSPMKIQIGFVLSAVVGLLVATPGSGQQKVAFKNNIPVAPKGLETRPLPDKPVEFDTAEGQRI